MALGKGLSSLIPPKDGGHEHNSEGPKGLPRAPHASAEGDIKDGPKNYIFHIEIAKIKPNPEQPRQHFDPEALKDLAHSIREFGVLQPLIVSKTEHETADGADVEYQLIAGERRLRASELAGLERVPVIVREKSAPREQLELAIIENLQREDLNPIEEARAFARLQDEFRLTQREIAARLGKSREVIANSVRLLSLPPFIQDSLRSGKLSASQGRALIAVTDLQEQELLYKDILRDNLSIREIRDRVKKITVEKPRITETMEPERQDPEMLSVKEELETFFGAPVTLTRNGDTGKIVISFYSDEELHGIVAKLSSPTAPLEMGTDGDDLGDAEDGGGGYDNDRFVV